MVDPNGSDNPAPLVCPKCGAENRVGAALCFLCETDLTKIHQWSYLKKEAPIDEIGLNPYAPPRSDNDRASKSDLIWPIFMLGMGVICVYAIAYAPGLGVPLTIAALIAAGRTSISAGDSGNLEEVGPGLKLAIFMSTLGISLLIVLGLAIAVGTALFAICACTGGGQQAGPQGPLSGGSITAGVIAIMGALGLVILIAAIIGLSRIRPRR